MAFAYAVSGSKVAGSMRFKYGTFTNGADDTGGDIVTGLNTVFGFSVIPTSHSSVTLPKYTASGGTVTLAIDNDVDGNWSAFGN